MKLTKHAWILWLAALAAVLTLALVIPFAHTAVYWLSLLCLLCMFGVCAFTFARAFRKHETLESKLLGWPIFRVGAAATCAQIVLGLALMALSAICPLRAALVLEALLFCATAFSLTAKDAAREAVAASETTVADRTEAWKAIRAYANALAAEHESPELRRLADEIRYADPTPSSMDARISEQLHSLPGDMSAENLAKTFTLLRERRSLLKDEK